jgi:hypothetical protein
MDLSRRSLQDQQIKVKHGRKMTRLKLLGERPQDVLYFEGDGQFSRGP